MCADGGVGGSRFVEFAKSGTPGIDGLGGFEVQQISSPRAWEEKIEKGEVEKGEQDKEIERKRRRRSILMEEEGALMGEEPVRRRSILGR